MTTLVEASLINMMKHVLMIFQLLILKVISVNTIIQTYCNVDCMILTNLLLEKYAVLVQVSVLTLMSAKCNVRMIFRRPMIMEMTVMTMMPIRAGVDSTIPPLSILEHNVVYAKV